MTPKENGGIWSSQMISSRKVAFLFTSKSVSTFKLEYVLNTKVNSNLVFTPLANWLMLHLNGFYNIKENSNPSKVNSCSHCSIIRDDVILAWLDSNSVVFTCHTCLYLSSWGLSNVSSSFAPYPNLNHCNKLCFFHLFLWVSTVNHLPSCYFSSASSAQMNFMISFIHKSFCTSFQLPAW